MGRVDIVTGERGSGKSTVCARVAHWAREHGLVVTGILTEEVAPGCPRRVIDLRSGESRTFGARAGRRMDHVDGTAPRARPAARSVFDPLTPGWTYEDGVFEWGNEVLSRSLPCDLLIIDELGPLEVLGNRGWSNALSVLDAGDYAAALVVCRPGLLDRLQERLGNSKGEIHEVDPQNRDTLATVILQRLLRVMGRSFPAAPGD